MADTAYNPTTNKAVRLEDNEWVPTDIATNPETGEIAIFDGAEWVIRKKQSAQKESVPSPTSNVVPIEQSVTTAVPTEQPTAAAVPTATPAVPAEQPTEPKETEADIPVVRLPTLEEKKDMSWFERIGDSLETAYDVIMGNAKVDPEQLEEQRQKYQKVRDELEQKVQDGTATGDERADYGKILQAETGVRPQVLAKTGIDVITTVPDVSMMALEAFAPKTAEIVKETDVYKTISSAVDAITPELTDEEEIAAELLGYLTIAGIGRKVAVEVVEAGIKKVKQDKDEIADALIKKFGPERGKVVSDNLTKKYGRDKAKRIVENIIGQPVKKIKPSVGEKVARTTAGAAGISTGTIALDLSLRDEDEQVLSELISLTPELSELAKQLEENPESAEDLGSFMTGVVNVGAWMDENIPQEVKDAADKLLIDPEDENALKVKKQFLDAAATEGTFLAPFALIPAATFLFKHGTKLFKKTAQAAAERLAKKNKAIKEAADNVPVSTETATVKESVLEAVPDTRKASEKTPKERVLEVLPPVPNPQVRQRNKITELLATINTGAGRLFRSNAALPEPIFKSFIEYINADKAAGLEIKKTIKDLKRVQKKNNDSDADISLYLNEGTVENLSKETIDQLDKTMGIIKTQENKLNDYLNLSGDNRIGVGLQDGQVYLTRTFEAAADPSWFKRIEKGLQGKLKLPRRGNADIMGRIERARAYFDTGEGAIPRVPGETTARRQQRVDALIERIVAGVSKVDRPILESIFDAAAVTTGMPQKVARSLKARKNIDEPVLDLLGQVKDPYRQLETTLMTQRQILSSFKYLSDVADFASEFSDKTFNLGGMFGFLPRKTAGFGDVPGQRIDLGEVADEMIGRFGGGTDILQNTFTTPQMATLIKNGTELFGNNSYGSMVGRVFSRAAAYGQATQTVLDLPAYALGAIGAIQALATNGYLVNTKFISSAIKQAKTFSAQVRAKDKNAIEELAKLKRQGVIDSDVTGEMLYRNSNFAGKNPMSLFGRLFAKGMEKAGRAYGAGDTYAKLIAHRIERQSLAAAFPEKSADEIFQMASDTVRNTMPSYTTSVPLARFLSRIPFGTYALYPTETVRTIGNMLIIGSKDIMNGVATKNGRLIARGMQRLGSLAAVSYGIKEYTAANNRVNGITEDTKLAIDLISPDYAMAANKFFTQPFRVDPETGNIMGRYTSSAQYDAYDFVKTPAAQLMSRLLSTGNAPESAVNEIIGSLSQNILSPYTNPKFVTEAVINILSGVDENGNPIYDQAVGATFSDKVVNVLEELGGALEPGTVQILRKYVQSLDSEEIRNIGQSSSGFPLNSRDIKTWMMTGIKPITINLDKAVGFDVSKDVKAINATKDNFLQFVRQIPDQAYTPELEEKILNEYRNLQERKRTGFRALSDKLNTISKIEYLDKQDKKRKYGLKGIILAATDKGFYDLNEDIPVAAKTLNEAAQGKGFFKPDDFLRDKRFEKLLRDKKYPESLIVKMVQEFTSFQTGDQ
jgi:hypothetical protein